MVDAYPLQWPAGKPRTQIPKRSNFSGSQNECQNQVVKEVKLLGGRNLVISTNIKLRQDGLPYASQRAPDDKGVAVYFEYEGNQQCFACDKWDLVKDNMRAIAKTIEALRGIGRWGSGDMVRSAFKGFQALPPPIKKQKKWYEILEVQPNWDIARIKVHFKRHYILAESDNRKIELQQAWQEAKEANMEF